MTDFFEVALRTTVCVFLECVETQVDIGAARVLVTEPRLKLLACDLLGSGDPLHGFVSVPIPHNNRQPVGGVKVLLDVAACYVLRLDCLAVTRSATRIG